MDICKLRQKRRRNEKQFGFRAYSEWWKGISKSTDFGTNHADVKHDHSVLIKYRTNLTRPKGIVYCVGIFVHLNIDTVTAVELEGPALPIFCLVSPAFLALVGQDFVSRWAETNSMDGLHSIIAGILVIHRQRRISALWLVDSWP